MVSKSLAAYLISILFNINCTYIFEIYDFDLAENAV